VVVKIVLSGYVAEVVLTESLAEILYREMYLKGGRLTYKNLLLPRVLPCPIRILLKRITVQHTPDIAAAAGILVVVPSASNTRALLHNDEVLALVAFD
jgi:hypothetical protein